MTKRVFTLLLAVIMLVALGGCGSSEKPAAAEATPAAESEAPVETASPEDAAPGEPAAGEAADSEEPSLAEEAPDHMEKPQEYTLPLYEQPAEISIFYPTRSGSHPSKSSDVTVFWKRLRENLGYEVTWTEPYQSTALEQFNLVIAAGEYPNIVFESLLARSGSAYTGGYDLAVDEEVYLDLTPYLEEYAPHYNYLLQDPALYNDIVTDSGRIVSFATINSVPAKTGMGPVINKEYFEATGLELPNSIDGLHDVAIAMRDNGVKSPLAVSAEGNIVEGLVAQAMGASFAGTMIIDNATGQLILDATTDQTREYIQLFRQWYAEDILDKEFISITEMNFTPFNNGEVGTSSGMGFMLDKYFDMYGIYQQPLPVIHGEGLEDGQILFSNWPTSLVNSMPGIALCTSCESDNVVEACMKLCDFFYSDAGFLAVNYGWIEGETYEMVDGKPVPSAFFDERDAELGIANKSLYTGDGDFGYVYPNFNFDTGSDTLIEASKLWTVPEEQGSAMYTGLPGNMKLTADESSSISSPLTDLQTYIESTVLSWMVLESDLDDAAWEEFVSTCQSMNMDEIIEVYTEAYTRYTSR